MEILNKTPFTAAVSLWEDREGKPQLTIILKATFSIKANEISVADEQLPIFTADQHYGNDPTASVRLESDMAPFKPRSDVVLVGRAHAPMGRAVTKLDVTVCVGHLKKTIRVFGDRKWWFPTRLAFVPVISDTKPFVTMDLIYERAFGGIDAASALYCKENIIGRGFIGKKTKKSIHGKALPNLEDPLNLIHSWNSRPKPVGFGFYGRACMPRLGYAGTYDQDYREHRAPDFPRDFSYDVFNAAHPDLQVKGYLKGDEIVELINLCPDSKRRFQLPGICPKISVAKWDMDPEKWIEQAAIDGNEATLDQVPTHSEEVQAVLDTLVFMPDNDLFYMVFRAVCPLGDLNALEVAWIDIST